MALSADEVQARVHSPVMRAGAFMPGAATVQPARLARGLRRVALERGVVIHEGTRVVEIDGERPGWAGGSGRATVERRTVGPGARSECGRSRCGRGARRRGGRTGEVIAGSAVVAMNAWAAAWPSFGRRLVTWSSYIVLTEPIPERLAEIGWTGGEGLADARFTLHYLRTTPDGRIAIGGGGGRAGFGGRIGAAFTDDGVAAARAAAGLRRLFPSLRDVRIEDAWGGPIDISADHLPVVGTVPGGRPIHFAHGYSGNGVGPSVVAGRLLAGLALDVAPAVDDPLAPIGPAWRAAAGVPAGAGSVRGRAGRPRGDRAPRGRRGARRARVAGPARGDPPAASAGVSPLPGLTGRREDPRPTAEARRHGRAPASRRPSGVSLRSPHAPRVVGPSCRSPCE